MPERAILSDVNYHLINLYWHIATGLESPSDWENSREVFEYIKGFFNAPPHLDSIQASGWWRAKAFYYLNRTCFNGLCRFNLGGEFNVGYGKYKEPILDHDFSLYQEAFENWNFFNSYYGDTLSLVKERVFDDHFVYADPPYDAGFTSYSGSFTWDDQVKLAEMLAALNCPVVASNKATDRIQDLYKGLGFDIEIISARRRISCNGDRTAVNEILATKNI
jgi:DNA adenine methylase (dam)